MNKFVSNVNLYIKEHAIKNNYIVLLTGWDKSKVSRLLKGDQEITYSEMECLADALGQPMEFFMKDAENMKLQDDSDNRIACFAGQLSEQELQTANNLLDMLRFYDSLTSLETAHGQEEQYG